MNLTASSPLFLLAICPSVRRTALAAGCVSALFSGGLPFVGYEVGIVMGRVAHLPSAVAFLVHLAVALVYGSLLSLVVCRSRDWWTPLAAGSMSLFLYSVNAALLGVTTYGFTRAEWDALVAHLVFGTIFTLLFKLAEIDLPKSHRAY